MNKALTIRQPWAWLIVNGIKNIENRSWHTNYRGYFYIHSSLKIDEQSYQILKANKKLQLPKIKHLQTGGIIGKAKLVSCTTKSKSPWFTGPYGFIMRKQRPVEFFQVRGWPGFFSF